MIRTEDGYRQRMFNDVVRLFSRLALGAGIAAHGAQKMWGSFDGPGPHGAAQFMESLGFVPGDRYASAASRTEIFAGASIVLGVGGPAGPAALLATMVVAQSSVHAKNGFFAQNNGIELGTIYATAALALASAGYGRFSLDEALGWHKLREPAVTALAVAAAVAAGLVVLGQRKVIQTPSAEPDTETAGSIGKSASPQSEVPPAKDVAQLEREAATTVQSHISAAAESRPVPADLLLATTDETTGL